MLIFVCLYRKEIVVFISPNQILRSKQWEGLRVAGNNYWLPLPSNHPLSPLHCFLQGKAGMVRCGGAAGKGRMSL